MQSWLDDTLNADVSNLGDMTVRVNLVRPSRLVFHDVEIEHPNPLFPGKLAVIRRMGAWASPLSLAKVWPGRLELMFQDMRLAVEENEAGEWSTQGLMRPLTSSNVRFPFPVPSISSWVAEIEQSRLSLRRRGYELDVRIDGEIVGEKGRERVNASIRKMPFAYGKAGEDLLPAGSVGPASLSVTVPRDLDGAPAFVPGRCQVAVEALPVATLPFFVAGIPMDDVSGTFTGSARYVEHAGAAGAVQLEGELTDAPLAVFGLPRNAPLRLTWPIFPVGDDSRGRLHMGPSGFGAFEMDIPLDSSGKPRLLAMRGDVAALDDLPTIFTKYSKWPDWLSRTFPSIEWRSGTWLGFGWNGTSMRLNLTRHTAGLSLSGEAEMMGGRVRLVLNPDQPESPLTIAAEKLDAQLLAVKLSQMLPEAFRAHLTGAHVNLTWMGSYASEGGIDEWGSGLVFAKPVIDVSASGTWWRGVASIPAVIADALQDWGGGDDFELRQIAVGGQLRMDQLSIVGEKGEDGSMAIEFRVYGDVFGQATGIVERLPDGVIGGELLLAGPSRVLDAVEKANPEFGAALRLLANDSLGMRVTFQIGVDGNPVFDYPFLVYAKHVYNDLLREGSLEQ